MEFLSFSLSDDFVESYKKVRPAWGLAIGGGNFLSELMFVSKYSRKKEDGTKEQWYETCRRCIEGYYSILKDNCKHNKTPWNEFKAQKSAEDAYARMFAFKWTPPGRGMANMGTPMVHEEGDISTLINCAAVTTEKISHHSAYEATFPFVRLMEMSMRGEGVGFDTRGAGNLTLHNPTEEIVDYVVGDTREDWAKSVGLLLETFFFKNRPTYRFDYSEIRPAGTPLKRFGGNASGPGPLKDLHDSLVKQLSNREGETITSRDIVDIMNKIGKAVVAGGARRSALLSLGEASDEDYVNLKNWELPANAERTGKDGWAWTSNNSIIAKSGDNLDALVDKIAINGEPGIIWTDTMSQFGRIKDPADNKDRANLTNPCAEIPLESSELCCLSELYPARHTDLEDFKASMKHAYMYAKAVVLLTSPWGETNEVITRNRRIGVSMTGVVDFIENRSWFEMQEWMDKGYDYLTLLDKKYSAWLGVRESIRLSTIKPAGSTSLLASTTAGVHWPTTTGYFIRRMRFLNVDPMVKLIEAAGYRIEPSKDDPKTTVIAEFPTAGLNVRSEREVSIWEKAHLAAMAQKYWSDNMVSVTVSFDKDKEYDQIGPLLRALQGQLKSVSFLPIDEKGTSYVQPPFEPATEEQVLSGQEGKKLIKFYKTELFEAQGEKYCTTDACEINF